MQEVILRAENSDGETVRIIVTDLTELIQSSGNAEIWAAKIFISEDGILDESAPYLIQKHQLQKIKIVDLREY